MGKNPQTRKKGGGGYQTSDVRYNKYQIDGENIDEKQTLR